MAVAFRHNAGSSLVGIWEQQSSNAENPEESATARRKL